ncbi:ligase-associated DNA damage response DEXH box helicase [Flavisolibacter nicotianae]|uniref:ligase-associated DNA damage response DEXH box helicase n=1 Tax=Flavisolibacter nicotianae TaxID=2364882 RepID=UPI000EB54696|nr:ligase-associated DNA damage response DEXH box helicase [Flavisolibacter nicotianae]
MKDLKKSKGYAVVRDWLATRGYKPFAYQEEAWRHICNGESGLVNAPTGTGKTFSVFLGAVIQFINLHPKTYQSKAKNGLQLIWITPLRALAKDIGRAMEEVLFELDMRWQVGIRNGDTSTADRAKQKRQMPEVLIITPESLHLLLTQKGYADLFRTLKIIAADEWHELVGSKRGVQVELALSRIVGCRAAAPSREDVADAQPIPGGKSKKKNASSKSEDSEMATPPLGGREALSIWGISATIGNLEQAKDVLLAPLKLLKVESPQSGPSQPGHSPLGGQEGFPPEGRGEVGTIVRAKLHKQLEILSVLPDEIEKYPWAGHLGIKLAAKILPILEESRTTLIFINTRGMSELWYQTLLTIAPHLAGALALHHGSIEKELRTWVEEALHEGKLKAVVCTASLDLGVDFRPVETVIQVGSPKGVARFLQRAGRSGHSPEAISRIYFLPTHSLELIEAAALKSAIGEQFIESREPLLLCYDVLVQYLCTLACSDGFIPSVIFEEVKATNCFAELTEDEWNEMLYFITSGGNALQQYDEYKKVEVEAGVYRINSRRIAMRHRLHIGTIVSDNMMKVKFLGGGYVGVIEESFISRLEPGDAFTLAGRHVELVTIKEMTAFVKKSTKKNALIPSWMGGRLPLSASLGKVLRQTVDDAGAVRGESSNGKRQTPGKMPVELEVLQPLFDLQRRLSHLPKEAELLIEQIETRDGFHLFVYPFEGRLVHEAMAALLAYRISRITPITFSIAMNDYGFELLSDQPIPVDDSNVYELFSPANLIEDIQRSVNATEMAKRKFRDIAVIGGLIFQGFPGEYKKARHLQASAGLLFNVFNEYDAGNVLIRQAYQEVFDQQMEEARLREMLQRVQKSRIVLTYPERLTPFCFPIKVDSLRENLTSEKLADRVRRMQSELGRL